MTDIEELEDRLSAEGVEVWDRAILPERLKGLYHSGMILLNKNIDTSSEKLCVLAEEAAHYELSVGDITDQSVTSNRKQELKAHKRAAKMLVTPDQLHQAFKAGCRNRCSIADHIGVTEEFLEEALHFMALKFPEGFMSTYYFLTFEPLSIIELIK